MKMLPWILLAIAGTAAAQASDTANIDLSGNLIGPPCVPRFPSTQQLDLGRVSLGQLASGSVESKDVALVFDCRAGTRVSLTLSAGLGSADRQTLLTDRNNLGLRLSLLHNSRQTDFSLGAANAWLLTDTPLQLNLRVTPVALDAAPEVGSYKAVVLMEMTYL